VAAVEAPELLQYRLVCRAPLELGLPLGDQARVEGVALDPPVVLGPGSRRHRRQGERCTEREPGLEAHALRSITCGPGPAMRIVSLIASSTEMVCALDCGDQLVARSHECDFPEWVKARPAVTRPKFALDGTSYDIDQRVKAIVEQGLSVYQVDAEALEALQPDLIITQEQCEVCAVSTVDVEAAVAAMVGSKPRIVALEPNKLDDIWDDIERVAEALDVLERGRALVGSLEMRSVLPFRPRVAFIEWIDPLMAGGNWMPELIRFAGGVNLFGTTGAHSPPISWDELVAAHPDVVVVSPCGFDLARTRGE